MTGKFRMIEWLLVTLLLVAAIAAIAPHQLPVVAYKLMQVTLFGWIGYWLDRRLFPYARPDGQMLSDTERAVANLRRAIVVGCAMLAGALGA